MGMAAMGKLIRCSWSFRRRSVQAFAPPLPLSLAPCTETVSETYHIPVASFAMLSDCRDQWQKCFLLICLPRSLCGHVTSWSAFQAFFLNVTGSDESSSDMTSPLLLRSLCGCRRWPSFIKRAYRVTRFPAQIKNVLLILNPAGS